jgi:hypothetical protein
MIGSAWISPSSNAVGDRQSMLPVYAHRLNPEQAFKMFQKLYGDERVCGLMAPKVTIAAGSSATVIDERQRPFVTSFARNKLGNLEPSVSTIRDGFSVQILAYSLQQNQILIDVSFKLSQILDVKTRTLNWQSKPIQIQVPVVSDRLIEVHAELASQDTLVIAPLERDSQGRLNLLLITPRELELPDEEEELLGLPRY